MVWKIEMKCAIKMRLRALIYAYRRILNQLPFMNKVYTVTVMIDYY